MTTTVAEYVVQQIAAWGSEFVFGLAGDTVIPLLEALRRQGRVRYVGTRHEEGAAFMASAYAKLTGRLGVCMAEAGPASVHLLNGVYDAHMDRVPLLALTGQVETRLMGTRWPQAINQDLLYQDAVCFNHTLAAPEQLPEILYAAMRRAVSVPGAARLGLPVDLQMRPAPGPVRRRPAYLTERPEPGPQSLADAAALLDGAQRPLLFVGQGTRGQTAPVLDLAEKLDAAIIHTIPAMGVIPAAHPRNLGVIGHFGTPMAAEAFAQADVVLVIGSTWWQPEYVPDARFIQIDHHRPSLGLTFPADVGLAGDAGRVLSLLLGRVRGTRKDQWRQTIDRLKAALSASLASDQGTALGEAPLAGNGMGAPRGGVSPRQVMAALTEAVAPDAILCLDVGENTFWVARLFQARHQHVLLSGNWRSMGFGLPAAMAAALAAPRRQVVAVVGDGGFAMTMAELATAAAYRLPITVIILNNRTLAQEGHTQVRTGLEPFGVSLHNPDFAAFARCCGAEGFAVDKAQDLPPVLRRALGSGMPTVIDVDTQPLMPQVPRPQGTLKPQPPSLAEQAAWLTRG